MRLNELTKVAREKLGLEFGLLRLEHPSLFGELQSGAHLPVHFCLFTGKLAFKLVNLFP